MADDFSCAATAKRPHKATPFDHILTLEKEQEERLAHAIAEFDAAERTEHDALQKRQAERVEQTRSAALEELKSFKQKELPAQLKKAEEVAAAERARIDRAVSTRKALTLTSLIERMLSPDFLARLR